ncbi:XdhC family protein [Novosphingobium taihuense]|uniref:Xanthine dehydrogenase accessory factor n=1 Tax=Novosphingobium taihuense TaxID=260085 RepID=A0A7W7EU07_9SPHN|nr:XdhC family protein [Novosphingobium taihuense]MBB4613579.1 xanthine dehydrogenase accessory factor [Novosphingobium taihuense]TWH81177.1 xanthine dehydrogenase accessory factor [Novosphingobium taihuense]
MVATTPLDILNFLAARAEEGIDCTLITLVAVIGGSSRGVGAQMAVAADGRRIGSFSGGCVEDAVAREAIDSLDEGWGHVVRYGVGSPYIDIRLPCGGGIDLLFTPRPDPAAIKQALRLLEDRHQAALRIECDKVALVRSAEQAAWDGRALTHCYQPPLKVHAFGQGEDLTAFCRLAKAFGTKVHALSPESETCRELEADDIGTTFLHSRNVLPLAAVDPWSAIVFLFHGRDWEEGLLPQTLALPAFYHGAIGSRRTHAARLEALRGAGVSEDRIAKLRGHIGLIPATRDPATLAISVLGEIIVEYNALASWTYWTGTPLETEAAQ